MIACDACHGTGLRRADTWDTCTPCPVCEGHGKVSYGWLAEKLGEHGRTLRDLADPHIKSNRIIAANVCVKICDLLNGELRMGIKIHHECHAVGCGKRCPPRMLFCGPHWRMVPRKTQITVWNEYRPGQEVDKKPSLAYLAIQQTAVAQVAEKEGRPEAAALYENALRFALRAQKAGENFHQPPKHPTTRPSLPRMPGQAHSKGRNPCRLIESAPRAPCRR